MEIDFTCIVDSCSNMGNSKSAGYCYGHYEMIRRYGTAMPTMICPEPTCQKSFVYQGNSRRNHRSSKRVPYCEECCNLLVKFDSLKISNLAQISKIAHLKMFMAQDFKCKICKEKTIKLCIDHDHNCCPKGCHKCIRSLLCHRCNGLVGYVETNGHLIDDANKYLESYKVLI